MAAHIENYDAYDRAVKRNILANANKTFERTYEDAEDILDAIRVGRVYDDQGNVSFISRYTDDFMGSMAKAYDTFGKLTPNQVAAVRKCIASRAARRAEWADKQAALNAKRQHLGVVGEKITLTLTIVHVVVLHTAYGTNYIYIMEDSDENVVIYKGKSEVVGWTSENVARGKGDTFTITATVKEHGVRDGVKQTVIQRPKAA